MNRTYLGCSYFLVTLILLIGLGYNACAQASYKVGQKVKVQWHGQWFPASILEVGKGREAGKYKIRYEGYGSNWDEYVGPSRIWQESEGQVSTTAAQSSTTYKKEARSSSAAGRYVCQSYNWQNQQLDTQDEFVLKADGTYQSLMFKQGGNWTQTNDQLVFTGRLNNKARARYIPDKKGMIVFEWSKGVRLDCYRQSQ